MNSEIDKKEKLEIQNDKEISQEQVWNIIAEQWSNFRQRPSRDIDLKLKYLAEKWKPGRILDIGCGNCRNLLPFCFRYFKCYGIDFSENMLEQAEKYCEKHKMRVALKKSDASDLSFPNNSFDYVLCLSMLHNMEKGKREKTIKEIKRILKNNGEALISVWNKMQGRFLLKKKELKIPWRIKGKTYERYYYLFTPIELKNLFRKYGFKILKCNFFGRNINLLVKKAG